MKNLLTKKNRFVVFTLLTFLFFACKQKAKEMIIGNDDNLSLARQDYKGTDLRLNGYFYNKVNKGIQQSYFFYNNGVVLCGGASGESNNAKAALEETFMSPTFNTDIKKTKSNWGLFKIKGGKIFIEHWYPSELPLKSAIKEGIIINDSLFKITSVQRSNGSEFKLVEEFYEFKPFNPKPDSNNVFVQ